MNPFYTIIAQQRGDNSDLQGCISTVVSRLLVNDTSSHRPGVLLGKIQSGKTRAFLGIIASAFDNEFDAAIVLTKGTKTLAKQTIERVQDDFKVFTSSDAVQIFDIMFLPKDLTKFELNQKLIIVSKKESNNLERLLKAFRVDYPSLRDKRVLIIDDEADFASLSFRKNAGEIEPGVLARKIDELRDLVKRSAFLQVTATPYSLYLQPEEETIRNGSLLFKPKKPAFTELLPIHEAYVGGEFYFEESADENSSAFFVYEEVPLIERDALQKEDGRRFKLDDVMIDKHAAVIRRALMNFIVGGCIRRFQQRTSHEREQKYSFIVHTEQTRAAHSWQVRVVQAIKEGLVALATTNSERLTDLVTESFEDLLRSLKLTSNQLPEFSELLSDVKLALESDFLMITKVNSEKEVEELLDERGQLKLRTPLNIFIGGQILDRGVTIQNLIGFYYGRNPKKFQQDTVLQHSRMYGARNRDDLAVTRFYTPRHIYQTMQRIHEFDTTLRRAFEDGAHDQGVYFICKDATKSLVPCSPQKLMFSSVTTVTPSKRFLPVGFQTVSKSEGRSQLELLDRLVEIHCKHQTGEPVEIDLGDAIEILSLSYRLLEFEDEEDDLNEKLAIMSYLSKMTPPDSHRDKVWLMSETNRNVRRIREKDNRFSNAPDTKQQAEIARRFATKSPFLLMLRQNGLESEKWRGLPFWWPVIIAPTEAETTVFADESPQARAASNRE